MLLLNRIAKRTTTLLPFSSSSSSIRLQQQQLLLLQAQQQSFSSLSPKNNNHTPNNSKTSTSSTTTTTTGERLVTVSLVGRPNTGKSTLFNRLTHSRNAIVSNVPGTTRDRKEGIGYLAGFKFRVFDTGGYDDRGIVSQDIQKQVQYALSHSDLVLLLVDTRVGVTGLDEQFARWMRLQVGKSTHEPRPEVVLVANKAEGGLMSDQVMNVVSDGYKLGFGEPLLLSAIHGDGLTDLASRMFEHGAKYGYDDTGKYVGLSSEEKKPDHLSEEGVPVIEEKASEIQLAVMGRPNVGKSTLINAMIGEERVIAGALPGLTRDSITVEWSFEGRGFKLVDTAGLTRISTNKKLLEGVQEKKLRPIHEVIGKLAKNESITLPGIQQVNTEEDPSQFSAQISEYALLSALNALKYAQVVMLVVEAHQGKFLKIDLQLARRCLEEGRALFIVANKVDLLRARGISVTEYEKQVKDHANEYLREFGDIPVIATAGIEGQGLKRVLRTAMRVHDSWDRRISTWLLNNWMKDALVAMPLARAGNKVVKVKYMVQTKNRPPTFTLFSNAKELPGSYERFLRSRLQDDFHFEGVPIRFNVKKSVGKAVNLSLLRQGKHSRRGTGRGDVFVGPNRDKKRLMRRIRGDSSKRRILDKRMKKKQK
eukprot:gene8777-9679_t